MAKTMSCWWRKRSKEKRRVTDSRPVDEQRNTPNRINGPQILDCYICSESWSIPVFQCENGHISCSSCCTKIENKCPSCGSAIGPLRCPAIEKVLESMKISCQNSPYGCQMTMNLNQKKKHESMCVYVPCSCPLHDCFFVGSSERLYSHFSQNHKGSTKSISYNSKFTLCLNPGDRYRIFQAEEDGTLFFLAHTVELFGNAITVCRIGPSTSQSKFCYEIKAKTEESSLCLQSVAAEIQARVEIPPSKGSLLIPNDFFGPSLQLILEFRIWPVTEKKNTDFCKYIHLQEN